MLEIAGMQIKESEDYRAKLDRSFDRVDGVLGNMRGVGFAERCNRWDGECLSHFTSRLTLS